MKKLKSNLNEPEIIKNLFEKLITSEHHVFPARGKINITEKHGVHIIYKCCYVVHRAKLKMLKIKHNNT